MVMNQEMGMEFPSMREWIFYEKDHLSWSTRGKSSTNRDLLNNK